MAEAADSAVRINVSESSIDSLRARGMRDLGPDQMRRFRQTERVFLDTMGARGFDEIRTPTIEPLHLFTASGALSPQLLDRVYSFLDWDGWSGERVVLRPDATVPAARWYTQHVADVAPSRLCYVQSVYRFVPDDASAGAGERQLWQCGAELFGAAAPDADAEIMLLAAEFVRALGRGDLRFEVSHAGLVRAVLASAGLDRVAQQAAYDRLLDGDQSLVAELAARGGAAQDALRVLQDVAGTGSGYVANLRALLADVPAAAQPLDELEAVAQRVTAAGYAFRLRPGTVRNFEYYTGVTFRLFADGQEAAAGGRYDALVRAVGDRDVPAVGFGADLLRLAGIA